ncbi:MAG: 3-hydroxylacyl-ACP dehydratase [Gammaproteobacteria bacterium]|nr:MAG: 3-hydroxylacyl-ACP dehydratase [Gammaproteobacteria bacterium]
MTSQAFADYSFESVVPHTGTMVLLDHIDFWDEHELQASVTVRPDAPFADERGIPAWIGIELMAQSIGAFGGCRSRHGGQPVKIGFLVGSRRYTCTRSYFPIGAQLQVQVKEIIHADNGLCVFECNLRGLDDHADIHATANINVFQPEDPEQFLQGKSL